MRCARRSPAAVLVALVVATACAAGGTSPSRPFRVAAAEPRSLDPPLASRPEEAFVVRQLFDGLVRYDDTTAAVLPNVATSWETSPDNTRFTFHLRPRSRFSNGEVVTAESFVRGMSRALQPALSHDPGGLGHELDGIVGADDVASGRATTLVGAKSLDPQTLEIRLRAPDAEFLVRCGDLAFSPVPSEAVMAAKGASWGQAPIGNGPFKMARWEHGRSITLIPNSLHSGVKPRVGRVVLTFFGDLEAAYDAWRGGRVDWAAVPTARIVDVIRLGKKNHINRPLAALDYLEVAAPASPVAAGLFRQALSLAIDRSRITAEAFDRNAAPATGIVPPLVVGSASANASDACPSCGYDPGRARQLLARSGIDVAGVFPLYFQPGVGQDAWMLDAARDLKANLGIDAQALPAPASLSAQPTAADLLRASPSGAAAGLSWIMRYATAGNVLQSLLGTGGPQTGSGYANSSFDALVSKAGTLPDPAQRAAAYQKAERLALADLPIIPLWWPRGVRLARLGRWGSLAEDAFGDPTLRTVVAK